LLVASAVLGAQNKEAPPNPEPDIRYKVDVLIVVGHPDDDIEVAIAIAARRLLAERGVAARVVSVPCLDRFMAQTAELRQAVVGDAPVKVAVEAGIRQGWDAVIGTDGAFVGMSSFGASAPYQELYRHFGITPEKVAEAALAKLGKS